MCYWRKNCFDPLIKLTIILTSKGALLNTGRIFLSSGDCVYSTKKQVQNPIKANIFLFKPLLALSAQCLNP